MILPKKKNSNTKPLEAKNIVDKIKEDLSNDDLLVEKKSGFLEKKRICIAGGGGIAAIELPRLARELRRHGAQVQFFVTENCLKFIGIDSLKWASNADVVVNPSGFAEHICNFDAMVVAPATADLISKITHGICSDNVTTLAQSVLGLSVPLLFCPTMHDSMFNSPIIQKNMASLRELKNVIELPTRKEEGKNKIPSPEIMALDICHYINKQNFMDPVNVIVTLGATQAMLDPVRCITNLSSGGLGKEVVHTLYALGVNVQAYVGWSKYALLERPELQLCEIPDYQELYQKLSSLKTGKKDGIFHILAGSDFAAEDIEKKKISSKKELTITLKPTQKIIDLQNLAQIPYKLACKLTSGKKAEGLTVAQKMLQEKKLNAILWNDREDAWGNVKEHKAMLLTKENQIELQSKKEIAFAMASHFLNTRGQG